jgi:DNA polymerase epsilon subunit 1
VQHANQKVMRYQLQDLRCSKTNSVATHSLAQVSKVAAVFKLDLPQDVTRSEIEILQDLAEYHELDELRETTHGLLTAFR